MKKLYAITLSFMLLLGLTACGSQKQEAETTPPPSEQTEPEETSAEPESSEDSAEETEDSQTSVSEDGKTLVVYYSATGNTKDVAEAIAEITGGELFELEPVEPYSADDLNWRNNNSRVSREHDNENERNVELTADTVADWDSYDTIYVGYPIWWGIAAWPVDTFIKANDFTGKTVIPFCTSASSGLGDSGELLAEMAGTGEWLEGKRFRESVSTEDVRDWVESLNLQ